MFSSDRSPWSLPPLCCSILLSLYRAHYAGICPSSWVFAYWVSRPETGLEWRQTSKCSVLTAILAPTQYRRNCTPLAIRALSSHACCSTGCYHIPTHSRCLSTAGLWVSVFSGRPPSVQFCYPQHASPPPGCSFFASSRHARYAGAAPVGGVLA